MNTVHINELRNIDYWVKTGAIDFDKAKKLAQPHIDAINKKSKEIAKKHGVKPRLVGFHNFVR
jgi:polyhydroxyalkanoate synthesis regulator phasin